MVTPEYPDRSANLHKDDGQYAIPATTVDLPERARDVPVRWRAMSAGSGPKFTRKSNP